MDENINVQTTETKATETQDKATAATPLAEEKPTTSSARATEDQLQTLMVENAKLKRAMERANSEAADYKIGRAHV